MKQRFLRYCSFFMVMMFLSNITLANLYVLTPNADNSEEIAFSTQKQEKSFWLKLVNSFANELEETEEKSEKEVEETTKVAILHQNSIIYSSFEFQKHLFATQINEWTHNHVPECKSKISKNITLSLHRFRL